MHILIAEDQEVARVILATHLRNWGHTVTETSNGAEALAIINRKSADIDMLITDWSMPVMDGLELASQVRDLSEALQYIYIILLTSRAEANDMRQGFKEGGVDDYVVKPFEMLDLQMRIQVGLRLIEAERTQRLYSQSLEHLVRSQTETIREMQGEVISRLFNTLESRDQETAEHVSRIGIMSAYLATELGWNINQVDIIRAAAPLHDVGKIGISDTVLHKPGPLSPSEFEVMKQHAIIGARILSGSHNPIIQMAEVIAHYHHENWDGAGYPSNLKGQAIPIEARIVAVADMYDALLSDRIYRKGLPEEAVLRIMHQESGHKLDPSLCTLFLNNLDAIKKTIATESEVKPSTLPPIHIPKEAY